MTYQFSRAFNYPYGEIVEISDNLRVVVADNRSPFTYTGTNTFIIGRGEVAILDPGPLDKTHLNALLSSLEGEVITHILVSHTHNDHVALTALLQEKTGAQTYAFNSTNTGQTTTSHRLDDNRDRHFTPDISLADADQLDIGGVHLDVIHTPGHTEDHLCFSLSQENALLCGDQVMGWSTSIIAPPDGHMGDYMASLEMLQKRPETIYHPTHGDPVTSPQALLEHLIAHRQKREQAILNTLANTPANISEIVTSVYKGLDKSLFGAAMLSTLAQIIWLMEKNMVENTAPDKNPLTEAIYKAS